MIGKTIEVYIDDMLVKRFVSKSLDKCLSFFKILRKNKTFEWTDESKVTF